MDVDLPRGSELRQLPGAASRTADGEVSHILGPLFAEAEGAQLVARPRSEEHTSELQSLAYLVCRLLLEKKKKISPPTSATPTPRYATRSPPTTCSSPYLQT